MTRRRAGRPTIPGTLLIGHMRYRVDVDQAVIDRANTEARRSYAGFSNPHTQTIGLRPDNAPDYQAETLLHEILHQCLHAAGCDPDDDAKAGVPDVEERAVRAIAGPLLAVLRRNPGLVAYLTAEREVGGGDG